VHGKPLKKQIDIFPLLFAVSCYFTFFLGEVACGLNFNAAAALFSKLNWARDG